MLKVSINFGWIPCVKHTVSLQSRNIDLLRDIVKITEIVGGTASIWNNVCLTQRHVLSALPSHLLQSRALYNAGICELNNNHLIWGFGKKINVVMFQKIFAIGHTQICIYHKLLYTKVLLYCRVSILEVKNLL